MGTRKVLHVVWPMNHVSLSAKYSVWKPHICSSKMLHFIMFLIEIEFYHSPSSLQPFWTIFLESLPWALQVSGLILFYYWYCIFKCVCTNIYKDTACWDSFCCYCLRVYEFRVYHVVLRNNKGIYPLEGVILLFPAVINCDSMQFNPLQNNAHDIADVSVLLM